MNLPSGKKSGTILSLENVEAAYGDNTVLRDINLEFPRGKITVILGESGCGKSTLMKNILLLHRPVKGKIFLFDTEITAVPVEEYRTILQRVGVLFQSGGLIRSFPIYENLSIPLRQHYDLPEAVMRRMVRTRLNMVELDDIENQHPAELSGGMQKRAGIARALTTDPELLFFDEPSSGLDPVTSKALDRLILRLNSQLNTTLVIVSHHMPSIRRIADRLIFLHNGGVLFNGNLSEAEKSEIPQVKEFFSAETKCEE